MTSTTHDLAEMFRAAANNGRPVTISADTAKDLAACLDAAHTCVTDHAAILAGQDATFATYLKIRDIHDRSGVALAEAKRVRRQTTWMVWAMVAILGVNVAFWVGTW